MLRLERLRVAFLLTGSLLTVLAGAELSKTPPANEYVDAHTCAGCHHEIYEAYSKTGMGRSLFRPAPSNTIEDYRGNPEYYQTLSDTHYSMIFRDGAFYQRRWQIGFGGTETNVEEMKVDYVVGAGDQARSYLHRTARGTLIELPLGWYSERGGYWAMSPGFDSRHPQTRRLVSYECMFCHTGYPQISAGIKAEGTDAVFGSLTEGIDCQRCHGPGGQHLRATRNPNAKPEDFARTIVNPARLDSKRQMEVCMQCHLEPTSTRLPSIIRKFNREPFSYIPGQPLDEFNRYFDFSPGKGHDDRFELVSAAYQLRKSRCFLESKEELTCLKCHDPHRTLPKGEAATQLYAKACLTCHGPVMETLVASGKHSASADCVSCHMPKRRTEDVVHAVVTDHLIQRIPPRGDLLAERTETHLTEAEEYHGEVVPYYPSAPQKTPENRLYRGVAQVALQNNLQQGVLDLSREMSLHPPIEAEFYTALGNAWQGSGNSTAAVTAFEHAVQARPNSAAARLSLAQALKVSADTSRTEDVLSRALHVAPMDPQVWYQYGIFEAQLGHTDTALEKIRKALALDPDILEGSFSLANLLFRNGQTELAETALQDALRTDPYDAAAYDLTGQILTRKARLPEALYNFEKAIHLRLNYAPYLYDYAIALIRAQRFDDARIQTQAAIKANPSVPEEHEILGSLFARDKQMGQAAQEYRRAVELQPDLSRAQLNLGLILAATGDMAGAVEHMRKAASGNDPNIAGRAALALKQIETH